MSENVNTTLAPDIELRAMADISAILAGVTDKDALRRVVDWLVDRYGNNNPGSRREPQPSNLGTEPARVGNEIPGVARLTPDGGFHLTIRDVKATSTNDAGLRLFHVIVRAHELLTGKGSVSSKDVILPNLRKYRAYTGNTRNVLAQHKGIVRNGDSVSLDSFCQKEADQFMKEIVDPAIKGSWDPSAVALRRKGSGGANTKSGKTSLELDS